MVPSTYTVVVCVMKGWRGKPLITTGLLKLFSSSHLLVTGDMTHTVVLCAHTVVVCGVKGGITMGILMFISTTHLLVTGEKTHTVVPYAHTVVLCIVKGEGGGPLVNMGP